MADLKAKLAKDPHVMLMFESPGQDGLKLFFKMSEKLYDPGKFSLLYKAFAIRFSATYGLEQVIDSRTSDVTRACFASFDPEAFFNPGAVTVNPQAYADFDNPYAVKELKSDITEREKGEDTPFLVPEKTVQEIPDEALEKIRGRLNPKILLKKQKQVYVPPEAETIVPKVEAVMQTEGIQIKGIDNISYGKKFRFIMGIHEAEINLFYGKKGYSVVISPRTGTRPELNELCAQLIHQMLYE